MGSIIHYNLSIKKGDFNIHNFLMLTLAGIINAVGITLLLAPVGLYDSGVSGLAMFLDMLISVMPLWSWLIIINFPIFFFGMRKQGIPFTVYSLYAILIYSLMAAVFQNIIPTFKPNFFANGSPIVGDEMILCSIFGGMLSGIGSGLTIRYGGTMDGIETLAVIFSKRIGISVGNFVMIFNVILYFTIGVTVMASGQGDFSIPLFSIIAYYVNGKAVDFISEGLDQAKGAIIITTHYDEVAPALSEEFGRGLTVINAKGYYSQSEKQVIYCVINRFQLPRLRSVVGRCDKNAFVTIMDISDVFGTSIKNSRAYEKKRHKQLKEAKLKNAEEAAKMMAEAAMAILDKKSNNENNVSVNEVDENVNKVSVNEVSESVNKESIDETSESVNKEIIDETSESVKGEKQINKTTDKNGIDKQ
jgi:uncharacterized membrane-anchored protein YitT (DUF2179 family)